MRRKLYTRRSNFTPRVASQILGRIAVGESLAKICGPKRRKGLPHRMTVYNWIARYPLFAKGYMIARMAQGELYTDELVEIADAGEANPQYAKMRVDARRWMAVINSPEVYARKLSIVGADGIPKLGPGWKQAEWMRREEEEREERIAMREQDLAAEIYSFLQRAKQQRDREAAEEQ